MEKKTIRTKKGVNPYTGAPLTIPAEKSDHQKLEEEVFYASQVALKDAQKYFLASDRAAERAKRKIEMDPRRY